MRSLASFVVTALTLLLAPSAFANWELKASSTCYDSAKGTDKLPVLKGRNAEIVAACLDVAPTDPSVEDHSLVFDSDTSELRVIRNCDALVVCDLSTQLTCAIASKEGEVSYSRKRQCLYDLIDFSETTVDGAMLCKESESYNVNTNRFKFKASCKANLSYDGLPCTLKLNTGKLFEETGSCPAP